MTDYRSRPNPEDLGRYPAEFPRKFIPFLKVEHVLESRGQVHLTGQIIAGTRVTLGDVRCNSIVIGETQESLQFMGYSLPPSRPTVVDQPRLFAIIVASIEGEEDDYVGAVVGLDVCGYCGEPQAQDRLMGRNVYRCGCPLTGNYD